MTLRLQEKAFRVVVSASFLLAVSAVFVRPAGAQDVSFSGSISDSIGSSLSVNSPEAGLSGTFNESTSNLNNPSVRGGVSDPTHSQLVGSTLTPFSNAYVNSGVQTAPEIYTKTREQDLINSTDYAFAGHQNQAFSGHMNSSFGGAGAMRARGSSMTQAGFTGVGGARAAFSGTASLAGRQAESAAGFSGEGRSLLLQAGSGAPPSLNQQSLSVFGLSGETSGFPASDPALTGADAGFATGPELHGDMAEPSAQAAGFFTPISGAVSQYAYDDGQTPLLGGGAHPGQVLGTVVQSQASPTGFPDSTRGLAGLQGEYEAAASPLARATGVSASPFAAVSETGFLVHGMQLSPNLHQPPLKRQGSFDAYERRLQEQRILYGMPISEARRAREQDRRNFERTHGHISRGSTLTNQLASPDGRQTELMGQHVIR